MGQMPIAFRDEGSIQNREHKKGRDPTSPHVVHGAARLNRATLPGLAARSAAVA
jgi:hypothetical protein